MEEDYVAESERLYEEQATLDALGISRTPPKADIVITGKMGEEPSRGDGQQELTEALAASRTPGAMAPMTAQEAGQEFAAGGRAVLGGVRDAAQGFVDMTGELGEYLEGQFPLGYITLDDEGLGYRSQRPKDMQEIKFPEVPRGEGLPENLARGITQFIAGMAMSPIGKGAGYLQFTKRAAWAESLFDPEQGNTATALKQFGLEGPVLDLLDSKVGEDADAAERLTARLKQATTGAIEGAVIDGLIAGIRAARTDEGLVETIRRGLAGAGQRAEARIQERGTRMQSGVDPTAMTDEMIAAAGRAVAKPDIDELGFFSKTQRAVEQLKQNKATGKQFLGMLKNSGVSETEIKNLELDVVLNTDQVITKDELRAIVEAKRPRVTEQQRTSQPPQEEYRGLRFSDPERLEPTEDDVREMMVANNIDEDLARQRLAEEFDEIVVRGIDEDYEIRGNDDFGYAAYYNDQIISEGNLDFNEARIQAVEHHAQQRQRITEEDSVFDEYKLDGGENYQELVFQNPESPVGFAKSHWKGQAPNYVAHARTTDRVDDEGRKILFVEEIQSDLNKEIRDIQKTINNITENFDEDFILRPEASLVRKLPDELVQDLKNYHQATTAKDTDNSFAPVTVGLRDLRIRLEEALDMDLGDEAYQVVKAIGQGKDVWAVKLEHPGKIEIFTDPETFGSARQAAKLTLDEGSTQIAKLKQEPFADTERYTQMVLRRLINKAVSEGYDGIGFTPGKFQASQYGKEEGQIEFYDRILPKQIRAVTKKIDKDMRLGRTKMTSLESYYDEDTVADFDMPDYQVPFLMLTDKAKSKVASEGLPILEITGGAIAAGSLMKQQEQNDGNTN